MILFVTDCSPKDEISPVFTVTYKSNIGGFIEGKAIQTVYLNQKCEAISAVSQTGYRFVSWSDGILVSTRVDENITSDLLLISEFEKIPFLVSYLSKGDGIILGDTAQSVLYGESGEEVVAIPNEGYEFSHWSDKNISSTRQDDNITKETTFFANFKKKSRTYLYDFNHATGYTEVSSLTIYYDTILNTQSLIPEKYNKVFLGWYLDSKYEYQAFNDKGELLLGIEIFDYDSFTLYAKWKKINNMTYRILLVYVTNIYTVLDNFPINYRMTSIEKEICNAITRVVTYVLNDWFSDIVTIEVDSYFTVKSIGGDSFSATSTYEGVREYYIMANSIPELSNLINDYQSIITTFSMNDFDNILHFPGGQAEKKYASLFFEQFSDPSFRDNVAWENILNPAVLLETYMWKFVAASYILELIHTIELQIPDVYNFHDVIISYNRKGVTELNIYKLYLFNKLR